MQESVATLSSECESAASDLADMKAQRQHAEALVRLTRIVLGLLAVNLLGSFKIADQNVTTCSAKAVRVTGNKCLQVRVQGFDLAFLMGNCISSESRDEIVFFASEKKSTLVRRCIITAVQTFHPLFLHHPPMTSCISCHTMLKHCRPWKSKRDSGSCS